MARHVQFTMATNVPVFFCDPHSPMATRQQREHERITPAVPSQGKRSLVLHSTELDEIAAKLNRRSRKTLGFKTPAEVLEKALREAANALIA